MMTDSTDVVLKVLKQTQEIHIVTHEEGLDPDILAQFEIVRDSEGRITVDREKRISLAMFAIGKGADITEVIGLLTWKDFEGMIANIMTENGFSCIESYRRRGDTSIRGMEIDVIGIRGQLVFSVDAKMWGIRGGKSSALRVAAEKQKERTKQLLAQHEHLSKRLQLIVPGEYEFIPILVTWLVEEVELHEGVPVIPVFKFNSFILDFDTYRDLIVSYTGCI